MTNEKEEAIRKEIFTKHVEAYLLFRKSLIEHYHATELVDINDPLTRYQLIVGALESFIEKEKHEFNKFIKNEGN